MVLLTARRITKQNVRRLSSASDIIVNILLLVIVLMGCISTLWTNATTPDFDYRQTISVWFRGLLIFKPDVALMNDVPLTFKVHIILGFLITSLWPFTRLVHVWSVPLNYFSRSYIIYRKHKTN